MRCIYESSHSTSDPLQLTLPFSLEMSNHILLPHDLLCLSWLLSCYPVSQLEMSFCHIDDIGAKLLVKHYPKKNVTRQRLEVLDLWNNNLTIVGLKHVMEIVRTSKPH